MTKAQAETQLAAAKLRTLAASQRTMASGYERQATHPAYSGQDIICLGKADQVRALAVENEAKADLIAAKAA